MKQRIRVVGITRCDDGILILKRRQGRLDNGDTSIWELPTGKINFGEQPEEAMSRLFSEHLNVEVETISIKDAVTFTLLAGASRLNNLYIVYDVQIKDWKKAEPVDRYSAYKIIKSDDSISSVQLEEASLMILGLENKSEIKNSGSIDYRESANGATVFVDGCSRGNPGPSGVGYYIVGENGRLLKRGGEFIGFATSRISEYCAMREGCKQAIKLGLKSVRFVSDNLMMINQLNGVYRVKNKDLVPIYEEIKELLNNFEACAFVHVKREQNRDADAMANESVDRHFGKNVVE